VNVNMPLSNEIHLHPGPPNTTRQKSKLLLFMITGNPGLIEYYRTFLNTLYSQLEYFNQHIDLHLYGSSLAGFELGPATCLNEPLSLDQQIESVYEKLETVIHRISGNGENDGAGAAMPVQVILIGHSVGAFVLLEVVSRWKKLRVTDAANPSSFEIKGGICLFPTVVDIAKSPTGRKVTVCQEFDIHFTYVQ
jgi:hypothetical protein